MITETNNGQTKSKALTDQAYEKIKQMLLQRRIVAGQRMVCKDLSEILRMSPTPIINALVRLEQEGFVASQANRGFYVKPFDLEEVADRFEVREALEVKAIEKAIQLSRSDDIERLEEKRQNHANYMPTYYDLRKFALDANFHIEIASISKNKVLEKMLRIHFEHLFLRLSHLHWDTQRMTLTAQEHADLVERIRNKDLCGGVELVRLHVQAARDNVLNSLLRESEVESIHF